MEHRDIENLIKKKKMERKRRELEKKRKMEKRVGMFFVIIISLIPCLFTIITKIDSIPLVIFDVLWFSLILIICIWTN